MNNWIVKLFIIFCISTILGCKDNITNKIGYGSTACYPNTLKRAMKVEGGILWVDKNDQILEFIGYSGKHYHYR